MLRANETQLSLPVERRESSVRELTGTKAALSASGLFAGIGGIELGLSRAGHKTSLLCEVDDSATAVLEARFPGTVVHGDIQELKSLPDDTELLAGGFPCQDLSQAGKTKGIEGTRSGLIGEVFRLLERQRVPWLFLENVPFMLQLSKGRALEVIVAALEHLGYRWAYRVVDARSFGLPQRRRRVLIVASQHDDPRRVLFADEAGPPDAIEDYRQFACGFYWTEGIRGLGWAVNAVPTLKGGSTVGVPSPPAIWLPDGRIVTPDIRDAERMQGFTVDWTRPAESVNRRSLRWKLVGNAVSVPVAKWVGGRLARPGHFEVRDVQRVLPDRSWPANAWNVGEGRFTAAMSEWPKRYKRKPLAEFLRFEPKPLSEKATAGFLSRTRRGSLRFPDGFIPALEAHLRRVQNGGLATA
jgi:DNA (cytosine-5)-methyltransferase 1